MINKLELDHTKNRVKDLLLNGILAFFLCIYFVKVIEIQNIYNMQGWLTGDWLINYSNGFIRRGLLGELADYLHRNLAISHVSTIFFIKLFLYAIYCVAFLWLCIRKKIGLFEIMLILSAWAFVFDLNYPTASGRKELILFAVFTLYALIKTFSHKQESASVFFKQWDFWYLLILLPLILLIHEGLFFFYQYFLLFALMGKEDIRNAVIKFLIPYSISLAILILMSVGYLGDSNDANVICQTLLNANLNESICNGAIMALGGFEYEIHTAYFIAYSIIFTLTFSALMLYAYKAFDRGEFNRCAVVILVFMLPTIPLYVFASDWGRWIHITAMLTFICILSNKSHEKISFHEGKRIYGLLAVVISVIYVTTWKIPHWLPNRRELVIDSNNIVDYLLLLNPF